MAEIAIWPQTSKKNKKSHFTVFWEQKIVTIRALEKEQALLRGYLSSVQEAVILN